MDASRTFQPAAVLDPVFSTVCSVLTSLDVPDLTREQIRPSSLLVEELGIDSLRFVDLTVALEDAFGFPEFPMQRWVDECLESDEPLTVAALVTICQRMLGRMLGIDDAGLVSSGSKSCDGELE